MLYSLFDILLSFIAFFDYCSGENSYSDPYRLFNLDVFEYELNNPMALYGSIPFMFSLSENKQIGSVGFFWANPSETWVDVRYDQNPKRVL